MKKKILIFGGYGFLGNILCDFLNSRSEVEIHRQGRNAGSMYRIDPTNLNECNLIIKKIRPDIIINLIASTNVDACESNPKLAKIANALIVENIKNSISLNDQGIYLIHVSTDQVYSGQGPHSENTPNPINIYAKTKLEGENKLLGTNSIILRTNFIGRSTVDHKKSFSDWIVESLRSGNKINVFTDIKFNPLHTSTLCAEIFKIINIQKTGIYNLGTKDFITKSDLAYTLSNHLSLNSGLLNHCKSSDIKIFKAKRNSDMTMDIKKYTAEFNFDMPYIHDEILKTANEYKEIK